MSNDASNNTEQPKVSGSNATRPAAALGNAAHAPATMKDAPTVTPSDVDPKVALDFLKKPATSGSDTTAEPKAPGPDKATPQPDVNDESEDKPVVVVPGGKISISESAENLFKIIAPTKTLFYRSDFLVEVVEEEGESSLHIVTAVAAQQRFEDHVQFVRVTKGGIQNSTPINEATAKQYISSRQCRDLLPKINGIVHCALLVERAGKLHEVKDGYDEVTGLMLLNAKPAREVPLDVAVNLLKELIADFDFLTPGDRSRALASIITPALKFGCLIKGHIPADVAEADQSQSGKSYRQRVIAAVYNQLPAVVTKKEGGVGSMEETFNQHLVAGHTFIQFDNVRGQLNSQFLESFLTGVGTYSARVPYAGGVKIDPTKFVIFISSNEYTPTRDLANRSSIIRIRKRKNHNFRSFNGKDLLQKVQEWQPLFLGAVFAVIREWHARGMKRTDEARHDFKDWAQSLDWIVQNILHEAPLMEGHEEAKDRSANPNLTFLRSLALKLKADDKLGQAFSATQLFDEADAAGISIPGISQDQQHNSETGKKQIGKIMSDLFKKEEAILIEDVSVTREKLTGTTTGGNWQQLNKYSFFPADKPKDEVKQL